MLLLFAKGKRPDKAAVKSFVASHHAVSISHDPSDSAPVQLVAADGESVPHDRNSSALTLGREWLELLRDGLAFDLIGLAPGSSVDLVTVQHRFDLDSLPSAESFECLHLIPGHHLTGGERTMPVVKALLALARDLAQHFDALEAVVWPPSESAIGHRFFESVSTAWLEGGPFPALGLTAFEETSDGSLQSVGLDFWVGQELRIEPPLSNDKVAATRLGVRIVNQLVIVGGLDGSERIVAPDGSRLIMSASRNGQFVRVLRE